MDYLSYISTATEKTLIFIFIMFCIFYLYKATLDFGIWIIKKINPVENESIEEENINIFFNKQPENIGIKRKKTNER
jgi:predicted RND superfamily exporter protein